MFFIGLLVGITGGYIIGNKVAIRNGKVDSKYEAALELRSAFYPTILKLKHGDEPSFIVAKDFKNHQLAAIEFSNFLSGGELESYLNSLTDYNHWYKTMCTMSPEGILQKDSDSEYLVEKEKDPIHLIKVILDHADV
ncbi:hypothetical protein BGP77_11590 [Saccharospirillum sp. MSK14-1]|uniref:hypothetical protein n=1 Tax=Saccharospirillum sp. MSK14-1 TaxID=1897632 RepID=UPI000D374CE7|nr:hypothetical protein [Saccharospirillum sp. MSK14-1]PTY38581.1 hypothetical protein BGP77_11590 [Saccharospirillum sp. MSK14-1]